MNAFTCSVQPCTATRHEAHGLCSKHYRASRPRKPDPKIELPCDGCGTLVLKDKRARRYATVQCASWVCRTWLTWGIGWASKLPADHLARLESTTCDWVAPRPAEIECAWCGERCAITTRNTRYCNAACTRRAKRTARRAREYNAPGSYTWTEITRLWVALDKSCAYCAKPTPLTDIQAEHVHPLSKHGRNDLSNMLPSCAPCNSDKRDLTLAEWAIDRARRSLPTVTTTWDARDPRYAHVVAPSAPLRAA